MRDNRSIIVIIITICIILGSAVTFGSFFSKAEDNHKDSLPVYKYYTSIEIVSGDTLWDIATEYISDEYTTINHYIDEVKNINSLATDDIYEGQFLTVPYYSSVFK